MRIRYKRPDKKNALSVLEAAKNDMDFTLSLKPSEKSNPTIAKNIYDCFRMLGDALMSAKGEESQDHLAPINEVTSLKVKTSRPINIIQNLRRLRININYYGYKPGISEIAEVMSIAKELFYPLFHEVSKKIKETEINPEYKEKLSGILKGEHLSGRGFEKEQ